MHVRSSDNEFDVNDEFFVHHADERDWLRTFLSTDKVRKLLRKDVFSVVILRMEDMVDRFELREHMEFGVVFSPA